MSMDSSFKFGSSAEDNKSKSPGLRDPALIQASTDSLKINPLKAQTTEPITEDTLVKQTLNQAQDSSLETSFDDSEDSDEVCDLPSQNTSHGPNPTKMTIGSQSSNMTPQRKQAMPIGRQKTGQSTLGKIGSGNAVPTREGTSMGGVNLRKGTSMVRRLASGSTLDNAKSILGFKRMNMQLIEKGESRLSSQNSSDFLIEDDQMRQYLDRRIAKNQVNFEL